MIEETLTIKNQLGTEKERNLRSSNCSYVAPITMYQVHTYASQRTGTDPGFHQEIFSWMHADAERLNKSFHRRAE
jgi:hypothetical protein